MKNRTHPSANPQDFMFFFMIFVDENIVFRGANIYFSNIHTLLNQREKKYNSIKKIIRITLISTFFPDF